MTRTPKKRIDESNAAAAYRYLLTVMRDPNKRRRVARANEGDQARTELERLIPPEFLPDALLHGSGSTRVFASGRAFGLDPEELDAWCERWLDAENKARMWRALRQQSYKRRHRITRLALPEGLYVRLSVYAEDEGITLADAVDRLLALATNGQVAGCSSRETSSRPHPNNSNQR